MMLHKLFEGVLVLFEKVFFCLTNFVEKLLGRGLSLLALGQVPLKVYVGRVV